MRFFPGEPLPLLFSCCMSRATRAGREDRVERFIAAVEFNRYAARRREEIRRMHLDLWFPISRYYLRALPLPPLPPIHFIDPA